MTKKGTQNDYKNKKQWQTQKSKLRSVALVVIYEGCGSVTCLCLITVRVCARYIYSAVQNTSSTHLSYVCIRCCASSACSNADVPQSERQKERQRVTWMRSHGLTMCCCCLRPGELAPHNNPLTVCVCVSM